MNEICERSRTSEYYFEHMTSIIRPEVINFIKNFFDVYKSKDYKAISYFYDVEFKKMSTNYYENNRWPTLSNVNAHLSLDEMFSCLYVELTHRHLHSLSQGPTYDERTASFYNYKKLFNLLIAYNDITPVIPASWLWDMIDEFLNQFTSYCTDFYKLERDSHSQSPELLLSTAWFPLGVEIILGTNITSSGILQKGFEVISGSSNDSMSTPGFGGVDFTKIHLGYFSLIGLFIFRCITSDYYLALTTHETELRYCSKLSSSIQISSCRIAKSYHLGYMFFILRHYNRAISILTEGLNTFKKCNPFNHEVSYKFKLAHMRYSKMILLLALIEKLKNNTVSDSLIPLLAELHKDKISDILEENISNIQKTFGKISPKFISHMSGKSKQQHLNGQHPEGQFYSHEISKLEYSALKNVLSISNKQSMFDVMTGLSAQTQDECISVLLAYKYRTNFIPKSTIKLGNRTIHDLTVPQISSAFVDFSINKDSVNSTTIQPNYNYANVFLHSLSHVNEINRTLADKLIDL